MIMLSCLSAVGALNHQTAHHLFPGMAQCFYPIVTPIIQHTCEEFGIEYHNCGSVWDAIKSHVLHLKRLGQCDMTESTDKEDDQTGTKNCSRTFGHCNRFSSCGKLDACHSE